MNKQPIYHLLVTVFNVLPLKKKKIFFLGYYGSQYGCNPKYLSEFIVKEHPEWDVVWGFTQPKRHDVLGIRKVRFMSLRFFYELCTCQVLVTNYRMPTFYQRRKEQLYLQTWHSSLRLKAIEADAVETTPSHYIEMAKHDSNQISILLSGCQKSTNIFKQAFWYNGPIAATGTPRLDMLLHNDEEYRQRIRKQIGLDRECHVVLYAPTFRENHGLDAYDLDMESLCVNLQQRWGGCWKVLIRLHPHLHNMTRQQERRSQQTIDVTTYDDPQELLYISDVIVSDYSSLIFDFAYTHRPCFLYVPDMDLYMKTERQFYFNIDELPFPIIVKNGQLHDVISHFNEQKYHSDINAFLTGIGTYETGHACENVYKLIAEQLSL